MKNFLLGQQRFLRLLGGRGGGGEGTRKDKWGGIYLRHLRMEGGVLDFKIPLKQGRRRTMDITQKGGEGVEERKKSDSGSSTLLLGAKTEAARIQQVFITLLPKKSCGSGVFINKERKNQEGLNHWSIFSGRRKNGPK